MKLFLRKKNENSSHQGPFLARHMGLTRHQLRECVSLKYVGLFNNGTSRYIKNRALVPRIQKDLFFFSFFFPGTKIIFSISPFLQNKRKKRKPSQTDASVFKKADARFSNKIPQRLCPPLRDLVGGTAVSSGRFKQGLDLFSSENLIEVCP